MNQAQASIDATQELPAASSEPLYFAVSTRKLAVMSVVTLGLYEVWWFSWNWRLIKQRERSDIMPVGRAIFALFFVYDLFKRICASAEEHGAARTSAGALASGWIVLSLTWRLPDPYWIISMFAFVCLLPMQKLVNQINQRVAPAHEPNDRFSGWNIFGIVVGGIMMLLAIVGAFLPDPG
ncbi:MAG TPA: hypothetical protein VHE37_10390 [Nevskiaceae bacterium]|nr:hypothetical protein [Nevskiaceae bacterium]